MLGLKLSNFPMEVHIIGAGGTGARLVQLVTQFFSKTVHAYLPGLKVVVWDPDTVEEKNLIRQNFVASDVGKNKAQVVVTRYSAAFRYPNMTARTERFSGTYGDGVQRLILVCVDTPEARIEILRSMMATFKLTHSAPPLIVDGGNGDLFGNVTLYSGAVLTDRFEKGMSIRDSELFKNPLMDCGRYESSYLLLDPEYLKALKTQPAEALSCADLDQTMAINAMVATTMAGIVQSIFYNQPIYFQSLQFHLQHGMTTTPVQWKHVLPYSRKEFDAIQEHLPASWCTDMRVSNVFNSSGIPSEYHTPEGTPADFQRVDYYEIARLAKYLNDPENIKSEFLKNIPPNWKTL